MTPTPWVLIPDAAKHLGCSEPHLRRLFAQGQIKAVKTGKHWRTRYEWLDEYLTQPLGGDAA